MSDLDLTKKTNFSQNQNIGSSQNLKDQVVDAGADMKQRAGDALRTSTDIARDKFKEAADTAKDVASGPDQLQGQAREKQRSGADFIERFARATPSFPRRRSPLPTSSRPWFSRDADFGAVLRPRPLPCGEVLLCHLRRGDVLRGGHLRGDVLAHCRLRQREVGYAQDFHPRDL